MIRYKLKQIKALVREGVAKDVTHETGEFISEKYKRIGHSLGTNGIINGLLLIGASGKLYAVTAKSPALILL